MCDFHFCRSLNMYVRCRKPLFLLYFHQVRYEYSDHMKIIRTFSYLESRSDYLFYLSILILIVRNENSRYRGHLSMVSAFALLKKTYFYDIINTSKIFGKPIDSPLNCNDILCLQDRNSAVSILQNLNERKTLCIR